MAVIMFQDKCPTVLLQLFWERFLFQPARYSVQEMTADMSGPGNAIQGLPVAANGSNRCVLNTQVFASCCEASLNETITTYCADLMDSDITTDNQVTVTRLAQLTSHISHT
jgi:hypothetical protein